MSVKINLTLKASFSLVVTRASIYLVFKGMPFKKTCVMFIDFESAGSWSFSRTQQVSGALGSNLPRVTGWQDQAASLCVRETPTASPAFQAARHLTTTSHFGILALFRTFQK